MGNNRSISQESSLFKSYNAADWALSNSDQKQFELWQNQRTGQHFQVHPIPSSATIDDLEKYQFRLLHGCYLVKVFDVLRLNETSQNLKQGHKLQNNVVLIEQIVSRFSSINWLTFEEGLYSLRCIFKGCSLMHSFFGAFDISQDVVGINQFGKVKIWLNPCFPCNHVFPAVENVYPNNSLKMVQRKAEKERKRVNLLIKKIFRFVENKVKNGFPLTLRARIDINQTFADGAECIQFFTEQTNTYLPEFIAIRNRKTEFNKKQNEWKPIPNKANISGKSDVLLSGNNFSKTRQRHCTEIRDRTQTKSFLTDKMQTNALSRQPSEEKNSRQRQSRQASRNQRASLICHMPTNSGSDYPFESNSRFSLASPQNKEMLMIIHELRRDHQLKAQSTIRNNQQSPQFHDRATPRLQKDRISVTETNSRSSQQKQRQQPSGNNFETSINFYPTTNTNKKYPPRSNFPYNKKIIESPKIGQRNDQNHHSETIKHEYQKQQKAKQFQKSPQIPIKKQKPNSQQTFTVHKKMHTESACNFEYDPSKNSTSLETRFPINSPKNGKDKVYYFKTKATQQEPCRQIGIVLPTDVAQIDDPFFSPIVREIHFEVETIQNYEQQRKRDSKQRSKQGSFQKKSYLVNRQAAKADRFSRKQSNNSKTQENIHEQIALEREYRHEMTDIPSCLHLNTEISDFSVNHTLMENLKSFEDDESRCPQVLLQQDNDEGFFIENTVQSQVDEMDDSEQLKTKLTRIKVDDLILQRKRRQTQQMGKKSATSSFKIKKGNLEIAISDEDDHFQGITGLQTDKKMQKISNLDNIRIEPPSVRNTAPPSPNARKNSHNPQSQATKRLENTYLANDARKKVKRSHDTIYIKPAQPDPYGIDAKYDKYVACKTPTEKKASYQSQRHKNPNRHEETIKKQIKHLPPKPEAQRTSHETHQTKRKAKMTYAKMTDFLLQ